LRALRRAVDDAERLRVVLAAASAVLVAFIALGKVSSPQYMIWLLPAGALAAAYGSRLNRMLVIFACALTQLEYPFAYFVLAGDLDPRFGLLVLLRDAVLICWAALTLAEASHVPRNVAATIPSCARAPSL
jgi:hypothetical protein